MRFRWPKTQEKGFRYFLLQKFWQYGNLTVVEKPVEIYNCGMDLSEKAVKHRYYFYDVRFFTHILCEDEPDKKSLVFYKDGGFHDDMFDLNGDGEMNAFERTIKYAVITGGIEEPRNACVLV